MIHVEPGITPAELRTVYNDARVCAALSRDGTAPQPVSHPLVAYYSAFIDGRFAGAFMAVRQTAADIEVHSLLLRHAVRYSRQLGVAFMAALFANPEVQRLTAWICADLPSVGNFCRRMGFTLEGTRRGACVRNQQSVDVLMFGLLRPEWSAKWAL